jgi:nitrite reductase/ring-hydroxylating ferredoxin subunit
MQNEKGQSEVGSGKWEMGSKKVGSEKSEVTQKSITRRRLLDYIIGGAFLITTLSLFEIVLSHVLPRRIRSALAYILPPTTGGVISGSDRIQVVKVSQLPVGTAIKTVYQGKPIVVGRTRSGFFALSAICTHQGCIVNWDEARQNLRCPCHATTFDPKGNVLAGPAPEPLPSYTVRVEDDTVYVEALTHPGVVMKSGFVWKGRII